MNLSQTLQTVQSKLHLSHREQIIGALILLMLLDYADRGLIGGLGPTLKHTFDMSNAELGYLSSAATVVGGLATLPFGILVDHTHRIRLLMISLIVWAVAVALTGAAISFAMLVATQVAVGIVSAATGPAVPSLIGDIVPVAERGDMMGMVDIGPIAGTGTGILLAAIVAHFVSFRWCFWLLAAAAIGLTLLYTRLREPKRTKGDVPPENQGHDGKPRRASKKPRMEQLLKERHIQPDKRAILHGDPEEMSMWEITRYVLRVRTDVIVLCCRAVGDYLFTGVASFGVVFATKQYGISQSRADGALLILGIGAIAGFISGGKISDFLLSRGRLNSRVWVSSIGYIMTPVFFLPAILVSSVVEAIPLLAGAAFFLAATAPALDAIRIDVIVPQARGRAEAIRQLLRTASEGAGPVIFGLISVSFGNATLSGLQIAFISALPVLWVAGFGMLLALKSYQPDVAAAISTENGDGS